MGKPMAPLHVKLIVGMLSADPAAFAAATGLLEERFGPIDYASADLPFTYSHYYDEELGTPVRRRFVSVGPLLDPGCLAACKLATNEVERCLSVGGRRRVDIDPGYISRTKLVLATTKDYGHRIYLGEGIYAEVTLSYRHGRFRPWPWTY
ncbi:MAG: DUF4416 family protein, partial [Anaerolineae bacterium]